MDAPKLNISPKLIKAVAEMYTDKYRVIMEYIDNSFDSAENLYDKSTNSYTRQIEIKIDILGNTYKDAIIKIKDNCTGINDITRIICSLGNSEKASSNDLNGEFGFGIYSFLAFCNSLKVATKVADSNIDRTIELNSTMFDKGNIDEIQMSMIFERTRLLNDGSSYTNVILSDFDKDKYRDFSIDVLKSEIEKHFELLLSRGNVTVSITNVNNNTIVCSPFNYDSFEGAIFEKTIDNLEYTYSKKYNTTKNIDISEKPISIFLKVTNNKVIDRKPFFVLKKRRISEISNVKTFNTLSKSMIWSHPNVTGYIDIQDLLKPTISRTDFKSTKESKALFQTLLKLESEIKKFVEENLTIIVNNRFEKLGKILSDALRDIAVNDGIKKQKGLIDGPGNMSNNRLNGSEIHKIFKVFNAVDSHFNEVIEENGDKQENNERARGKNKSKITNNNIELPEKVNEAKRANGKNDISSGIKIRIDFENDPMKDVNEKLIRSIFTDNELTIFKKHPEFEKRLDINMHGIPCITASLITYLCCEILFHYKIIINSRKSQNTEDKQFLNDFVESVYLLEANLKQLENKRISEFNE